MEVLSVSRYFFDRFGLAKDSSLLGIIATSVSEKGRSDQHGGDFRLSHEKGRAYETPYPPIDMCHVTDYTWRMIKTFADKETLELYETGKSKRLPPDIRRRAMRRLEYLDMATGLEDLKVPPSNRLHELQRERKGQYSISVNDQWRICFRFEDGDAYDVELTDYH